MVPAAADKAVSACRWLVDQSRYASPASPSHSEVSQWTERISSSASLLRAAAVLCHVWAWAEISAGSPASQSRDSERGLTCSISQATPYCRSVPTGSVTKPSRSRPAETPPIEPSTQLPLLMPARVCSTSSASDRPAQELTGPSTAGASSALGLVMSPCPSPDG